MPGLMSGCDLAFARALGEFGATLTFAGSAQGRTRTLPLEIYLQRETDQDAAIALSLVLVVLATVIVGTVYALGRALGLPCPSLTAVYGLAGLAGQLRGLYARPELAQG